jgi:hypothetical protein
MCCGNRRSAWRNGQLPLPSSSRATAQSVNATQVPALPASAGGWGQLAPVALHYTEATPIRVWGAVTGRAYEFADTETAQAVDPRDAAILTRGGLFRRAPA